MKKRNILILLIVILAAGITTGIVFLNRLPATDTEDFTYCTGIPYPADAVYLGASQQRARSGFKSEFSRLLYFRTESETVKDWQKKSPPYGKEWNFGHIPIHGEIPKEFSGDFTGRMFDYCVAGDASSGKLLAVDKTTGEAIHMQWRN